MSKRPKLADRLRANVVFEALEGNKTIQVIAAKHLMHPNQVGTWKRQAVEEIADVLPAAAVSS